MLQKTFDNHEFLTEWETYQKNRELELRPVLDEIREGTKRIDMVRRILDRKKQMRSALESGAGLGSLFMSGSLGDDYHTDPYYATNLIAHMLAAAYLLNGETEPSGKIVEVGFGKKVNDMHLPLLKRLGYDASGIETSNEAVEIARVAGYNAFLVQDLSDIPEILKGQDVRYVTACRMFEPSPFIFGEESEVESPEQLLQIMAKLAANPFDDSLPKERMSYDEAVEKARTFFTRMYVNGVTRPDCVHVYTTSKEFIPRRPDLERIGYKVLGVSVPNPDFTQAQFLTVFHV